MRQPLALDAALLGEPPVLILDEPANGLDPEGIAWLRAFLRELAREGRTVLSPATPWPRSNRPSTRISNTRWPYHFMQQQRLHILIEEVAEVLGQGLEAH